MADGSALSQQAWAHVWVVEDVLQIGRGYFLLEA